MEINFSGKRALVTGAAQGIGKEVALRLLQCGAEVVAMDRNAETLNTLKQENPEIQTICVDVTNWNETERIVESSGPFDLLVNNAGISIIEKFGEVTEEAFDRVFSVNLKAMMNISQTVYRCMKKQGRGGSIVNLSSQSSIIALDEHAVYCASKAGVNLLTKCMALELGPEQIRTNAVCPTVVNTEMGREIWKEESVSAHMKARIPMGKFAEPHHIADTIVFLLSDQAGMINGAIVPIDGGVTAC